MDDNNLNTNGFGDNGQENITDDLRTADAYQTEDTSAEPQKPNQTEPAAQPDDDETTYRFSRGEIKQDPVFGSAPVNGAAAGTTETATAQAPDGQRRENTYTPPIYNNYNANQAGQYGTGYSTQQSPPFYQQPVEPGKKKRTGKVKKAGKPLTRSSLAVACIATAVVASLMTGLLFSFGSGVGKLVGNSENTAGTSSSASSNITTIVADTTTETTIEAVADKVSPSVVGIVVTTSSNNYFYGNTESTSEGSGIIYTADGYIITNYHVVSSAVESSGKLQVYLPSDTETGISATVIGYDVSSDLAVIKIDKTGLTAIEIGDSGSVKVGQTAIAIGNPGGMTFMGSVSSGIISGLNRVLQLENTQEINLIQTDAAINPGNSGGPLVNSSGQLIGVNSAKMASTDYEGMGFAIPVNSVIEICDRIIQNKDKPAPYVGVELSTYYTSDTLNQMGYPSGVVVSSVSSDSPAATAGIQRGDIVTEFNGTAVTSYSGFNSEKAKYSPGDSVSLTIYRSGRSYTVNLTLGTAND